MNTLMKCYANPRSYASGNTHKLMMMAEILPEMTVQQAHELAVRILKQYTYEPSIAQILEVWRTMKRDGAACTPALPRPAFTPARPRQLSRLKQVREAIKEGRHAEMAVTQELIDFARSFFPHISRERIEANRIEISNCKTDREQDLAMRRGYMTCMRMDEQGVITLYMSPMHP